MVNPYVPIPELKQLIIHGQSYFTIHIPNHFLPNLTHMDYFKTKACIITSNM